MDLSQIAISNLEKQRKHLGFEESDIDKYAGLQEGTYLQIINGKTELNLRSLQTIVEKVFNSKVREYLNLTFKPKPLSSLNETIQLIAAKNKKAPSYGPLPNYLILIIHYKIKITGKFSNKLFDDYLPSVLKDKNRELKKYSLKKNISAIEGATEKGKNKDFNQFTYATPFTDQQIAKARKNVNEEWLKEFEGKIKKK